MEFNSGPSFQLSGQLLECLILLQSFDWLRGFYAHIQQKKTALVKPWLRKWRLAWICPRLSFNNMLGWFEPCASHTEVYLYISLLPCFYRSVLSLWMNEKVQFTCTKDSTLWIISWVNFYECFSSLQRKASPKWSRRQPSGCNWVQLVKLLPYLVV